MYPGPQTLYLNTIIVLLIEYFVDVFSKSEETCEIKKSWYMNRTWVDIFISSFIVHVNRAVNVCLP